MSTQSLTLRHGTIERRMVFASADAVPADEFLSEGEKEQAEDFRFAGKRQGFLLGRLAAKRALGALLEEPDLRQIGIRAGVSRRVSDGHRPGDGRNRRSWSDRYLNFPRALCLSWTGKGRVLLLAMHCDAELSSQLSL